MRTGTVTIYQELRTVINLNLQVAECGGNTKAEKTSPGAQDQRKRPRGTSDIPHPEKSSLPLTYLITVLRRSKATLILPTMARRPLPESQVRRRFNNGGEGRAQEEAHGCA